MNLLLKVKAKVDDILFKKKASVPSGPSATVKVEGAFESFKDKGIAQLPRHVMDKLGVASGDVVEINKSGVQIAESFDSDKGQDIIRLDGVSRHNTGASLGDIVSIRKAKVEMATSLTIGPMLPPLPPGAQAQLTFNADHVKAFKTRLMGKPVTRGDTFYLPGVAIMGSAVPFTVTRTNPHGSVVRVVESTEIVLLNHPVSQSRLRSTVTYDQIGGLARQIDRIRETIEIPLKHPELFERLGIDPPKGVIMHGPPGTGKTLIAKAVANEAGVEFYAIQGPEIISAMYGASEANLRAIFKEAAENAPAIIFIDELDSIAPRREDSGELERRLVAQLLTLMDGLESKGRIVVIGATNRLEAVDMALRRPGRFDREIEIGCPDKEGRLEILKIHTRHMPLVKDVDIEAWSERTHGFVGADLAALCREAAMKALRRYLPGLDLDRAIPIAILETMFVNAKDFFEGSKTVEPSVLRDVLVEVPNIKWDQVGGLASVKQKLVEAIEWPINDPERFIRMGIKPPRGVLLYGPPGCGKTLLAKAVATECASNFISVKGPEVYSKWVGDSEKAVRTIFKKAKESAPCIVFLDEMDALAPHRGSHAGDSGVSDKVVNQLLTCMDGVEKMDGVVIIGATNRPDMVDQALLRSGRFDRIIGIPPTDAAERLLILKVHTKPMPISRGIDLEALAGELDNYAGADIAGLCREAAMSALRKNSEAKTVTLADFMEAKKAIRPSMNEMMRKYYNKVEEVLGVGGAGNAKNGKDGNKDPMWN